MKKILITILVCLNIGVLHANDYDDFIADIDREWAATNFSGIINVIDSRLSTKTNDLVALIFKAHYYTSIELNMNEVENLAPSLIALRDTLDWSADEFSKLILGEMISSVTNKAGTEAKGYVYGNTSNELFQIHAESPTNYPGIEFLKSFYDVQHPSP